MYKLSVGDKDIFEIGNPYPLMTFRGQIERWYLPELKRNIIEILEEKFPKYQTLYYYSVDLSNDEESDYKSDFEIWFESKEDAVLFSMMI